MMNEITLPYHLVTPAIISILILGVIILKRKQIFANRKLKWFWISLIVFFLLYLFVVGRVIYDDIYAQWYLNKFDLNQDGVFSGNELTVEQEEAMNNLTNDIGRNFSFITGLFFAGIIAIFVFISGKLFEYIKVKRK